MPDQVNTNDGEVEASNGAESDTNGYGDHDPQFVPIVQLPEVDVSLNEDKEIELVKLRAKLFRFDTSDPAEFQWKERGTGEVKILQHTENFSCRVVMRRDKTLKICANHFITPWMELKPSFGSDRAWVWTVLADFADETPKSECLAIKFANATIANEWKEKFEKAAHSVMTNCELYQNIPENSSLSSLDALSDSGQSSESEVETKKETGKAEEGAESVEEVVAADSTTELTEKIATLDVTQD